MLLHPTLEKLTTLRLTGMAAGLLLDREQAARESTRMVIVHRDFFQE